MTASCHLLDPSAPLPVSDAAAVLWDSLQASAASRGDAVAFRRLVDRHGAALHRFCRSLLGCEHEAEDICQETFVRVWRALPKYQEKGQFRAWVWQIALNLCRDSARSKRRRARWLCSWPVEGTEELAGGVVSPDEAASLQNDLARLARGMELLPEKLRLSLWLFSVENLSQAECATVLGLSVRAVETRVFRARKQLLDWWNSGAT